MFNLDAYLARIGCRGALAPDLATLARLHSHHVNAIPFEGLDPLLGRPVRLDLASLQAKLVCARRGGYCFEQNALFRAALDTIGFRTTGLAGRVRWMSAPDSPLGPRTHMLLKVDLAEGAYLADVGFGACILDAPLRLEAGPEQRTAMGSYRLEQSNGMYELKAKQPDGWRTAYVFDLTPQIPSDYELSNWYTSTSRNVPFTSTLVAERVSGDRRYKLANTRLKVEMREGAIASEQDIASADDLGRVLSETFNLSAPVPVNELFQRIKP